MQLTSTFHKDRILTMFDGKDLPEGMKFRHEMKYLCTDAQLAMIKSRLSGVMKCDTHTREDGTYLIRSLYFDDYDDRCLRENIAGVVPREKYRIRIYNGSMDRISLERKSKVSDKIRKLSTILTPEQYYILVDENADKTVKDEYPELMKKLLALYQSDRMKPKVIVEYERRPFICQTGNVRITFDRNLTSSSKLETFSDEKINGRPVMPTGLQLLEVKYDEFLPDYIYRTLQMSNLQLTSYSKYSLCRKYTNV